MKQEMMGWQWHQLHRMRIIYTSLQTDNHASASSLNFLQAGCSYWCPANSVKAMKVLQVQLVWNCRCIMTVAVHLESLW